MLLTRLNPDERGEELKITAKSSWSKLDERLVLSNSLRALRVLGVSAEKIPKQNLTAETLMTRRSTQRDERQGSFVFKAMAFQINGKVAQVCPRC